MTAPPLLLAIDAGSPQVSVATGRGGEVLAERSVAIERSSGMLLHLIGEVLDEAGARPADLGGVVALRGPGSFTGLRVGLATALGLHQALEVPATALSTLLVLAARAGVQGTVVAAVDALRGEWSAQAFEAGRPVPRPLGDMELVPGSALPFLFGAERSGTLTGFGVSRLAELPEWPEEVRLMEAGPLAGTAVRIAAIEAEWNSGLLVRPLYSRPPAISLPKAPRRKIVT